MYTRIWAARGVLALLLSSLLAGGSLAQSFRGSVLGTITDSTGAVLSGATVTAKNEKTGVTRTTTSDADGNFVISELPIGTYEITVERDGFQKAVVAAGADVLVHMVQGEPIDEELLALLRQKQPYWATVIGLGDPIEVCRADPFFADALPSSVVAKIRATMERQPLVPSCGPPSPNAATREKNLALNFPRMIASGVKLVLATDTGIHPGHTFGSGEHVELARWVQLGLPPAQAIVAATKTPAELMGLDDLGTLAAGKRASFIVLNANPLDNIRNTRTIADVYLDGVKLDREALRRKWREQR